MITLTILSLIVLGALLLASFLDLKYRAIPSVFLTGLLFLVAFIRIENLHFGLLAVVFAGLIKELLENNDLEFGIADIKLMIVIGLMTSTINSFLVFIGIFAIIQLVYTSILLWKFGADKERPFVPCLLIVYVVLILLGVVA